LNCGIPRLLISCSHEEGFCCTGLGEWGGIFVNGSK
jgi:hypothetical protein